MNISLFAEYAFGHYENNADAYRHFYEKGARFVDITDGIPQMPPLHLYCKQIREGGLEPETLVTTFNIASLNKNEREKNIAQVKGYIDQMEKLHIPVLMPSPALGSSTSADECRKKQELLIEGVSEVVRYAKGSGVSVVIENQSVHVRPDSKSQDIRCILDALPEVGLVFDPANFFCIGEDSLKAYESLKDKIVRCHCKDWAYNPYGMYVRENMPRFEGVAAGEGVLPLKEFFAKLSGDGFDGSVVIEINARKVTLDMVDRSIEFLKGEISD